MHKRVWVSEWVVTSCQGSQNPSSLSNCCFSSGEEFSLTKNKKLGDIPEVTSFVTNLLIHGQLHWAWPKQEIQSLILGQKASEFTILDLNTFLDVMEIPKPFGCMDT